MIRSTLMFITFMTLVQQAQAYITPSQYYDPARKFSVNVKDTGWDFFSSDDVTSKTTPSDLELQFVARSPSVNVDNVQPTLTMRVDSGEWKSAKGYAEKWLKDFPKFGYELQMSREAQYGNLKGYDMELASTSTRRRARQFIVKQPHEMWIFTCSADKKTFSDAWKACEKILKSAYAKP